MVSLGPSSTRRVWQGTSVRGVMSPIRGTTTVHDPVAASVEGPSADDLAA